MRRLLLACLLPFCALGSLPAPAQTELRLSSPAPEQGPLADALRAFTARMNAAHPGQVRVSLHLASSLFRQGTEIPAMQRGNLEGATPVTFEIEQQVPETGVFGAAYVFRDTDHMLRTMRGEIGGEYTRLIAERTGIVLVETMYLGTRTVMLRRVREVRVPTDLTGVRLRMPPGTAYQALARAIGATAVAMPITEVYLALRTGAIDGQENPLGLARDWKFDEVSEQIVLTRHLVQPVFLAFTRAALDRLNAEQQASLRAAAREAAEEQIRRTIADEAEVLAAFRARGIRVAEPDLAPFREAVGRAYAETGAEARWTPGLRGRIDAVR